MVVSHRAAVRCPAHSRLSATTRLLVEYHPRHHHRDVGGLRDTGSNGFRYGTSNAPASRPATPGCAAHATKNPGDAGQYRQRYDRRRCCRVVTVTAAAGKFTNLLAGQWIRLLGYAASAGVNNNLYRITAMSPSTPATATALTLAAPFNVPVTETPATTTGQLRASQITNGVTFTSLYVQKQLQSGSNYLVYPGSYCTGIQIAGSVGQFVTANFPLLGKKRAPPRPRPVRPVRCSTPSASSSGITSNDVPISAIVNKFSITSTNNGAAGEYGIGSSIAPGILSGVFTAKAHCLFTSKTSPCIPLSRVKLQVVCRTRQISPGA